MSIKAITTPSEFLSEILNKNVEYFEKNALDISACFNACISCWALRDWMSAAYQGRTFIGANHFLLTIDQTIHAQILIQCPSFGIVSDICNASKHMILTQRKNTNMTGAENTTIMISLSGAISGGPLSATPIGGGTDEIVVKIDSSHIHVLTKIKEVQKFWIDLFDQNGI